MNDDFRRPLIIPSLASILGWVEAQTGTILGREVVQSLASQAPSMTLPESVAARLEKARGFEDLDPEAAFDQWVYLREQMQRQEIGVASAFPVPRDQLQSDLKILQQVLAETGNYEPAVIAHQVAALCDYASSWLTELERSVRG